MIKKTITYKDFNGQEHTEDFYFHLSKAELMELEMSEQDGLHEYLERIVETDDNEEIIKTFKEIIKKAHGVKSKDGKKFVKNEDTLSDFMDTNAYSTLFMEIALNPDKASSFINGIMPAGLDKKEMEKLKRDREQKKEV